MVTTGRIPDSSSSGLKTTSALAGVQCNGDEALLPLNRIKVSLEFRRSLWVELREIVDSPQQMASKYVWLMGYCVSKLGAANPPAKPEQRDELYVKRTSPHATKCRCVNCPGVTPERRLSCRKTTSSPAWKPAAPRPSVDRLEDRMSNRISRQG